MFSIVKAYQCDIDSILSVLKDRCDWMFSIGNDLWKDYTKRYDYYYFYGAMEHGYDCYLALDDNKKVVGTMMLEKSSSYFEEYHYNAYYVRHLTSSKKGAGKALLDFACSKAREDGKEYICGNCDATNKKLIEYYTEYGFEIIKEDSTYKYDYVLLIKRV